jgi:hypothetical protein
MLLAQDLQKLHSAASLANQLSCPEITFTWMLGSRGTRGVRVLHCCLFAMFARFAKLMAWQDSEYLFFARPPSLFRNSSYLQVLPSPA